MKPQTWHEILQQLLRTTRDGSLKWTRTDARQASCVAVIGRRSFVARGLELGRGPGYISVGNFLQDRRLELHDEKDRVVAELVDGQSSIPGILSLEDEVRTIASGVLSSSLDELFNEIESVFTSGEEVGRSVLDELRRLP